MRLIAMICAGLMMASPSAAQERETLGYGRIFTNDFFGDNEDRWRSGSYAYSIVRGPEWDGVRPSTPGAIIEYRLRSEIIAPSTVNGPGSSDRAYVGAVSAGVHTHFARGAANISAGVDLVATGPQTGILDMQDWFHDIISAPNPSAFVEDNQVENAVHPTVLTELSYRLPIGTATTLRPFVEAQYGVEDFVRVGADVLIGETLQNDMWLRDSASGQLYSGIESGRPGTGFVLGADYASVGDSAYFPASFGTVAQEERFRARAGVHWRFGDGISYFYGLTYLSEEYVGQDGGQIVGSLKLNFNF
ncbi:lipid A deacylase LpxR family protein [Octadecabacter sp. G9-8]|uniref:Lipid A deacylase LpxR family protein n=1 Tax=Octadecabacter dasysiphoniae TaxID=2909341 RepID=A0ABS9CU02_9RHOB|nr:lipid A-modifier LpxR family protein [Octadecabacter dasysiphoniae]MCF2869686.1 lipid A deacylase LpxR family protein [Octadecabacter dasysiphoniae]